MIPDPIAPTKTKRILLRPWRAFDPSVYSAVVQSGLLARFQKVDGRLVLAGFYSEGDKLHCLATGDDRRFQFRALTECELVAVPGRFPDTEIELSKSHEKLLNTLIDRAVLSSEDKLMSLFGLFTDLDSSAKIEVRLGYKALACCSMLSVRQVSRLLTTFSTKGILSHETGCVTLNRNAVNDYLKLDGEKGSVEQ